MRVHVRVHACVRVSLFMCVHACVRVCARNHMRDVKCMCGAMHVYVCARMRDAMRDTTRT